jgi:hypothetical protein
MRSLAIEKINNSARTILGDTDWYVVRMHETGTPVPAEVTAQRAYVRARSNLLTQQVLMATAEELETMPLLVG